MKKYKVIILCNKDGDYYKTVDVDTIDGLFDTKEDAEKVLKECLIEDLTALNDDTDDSVLFMDTEDNSIWYELDINGIYVPQYWVAKYTIIDIDV